MAFKEKGPARQHGDTAEDTSCGSDTAQTPLPLGTGFQPPGTTSGEGHRHHRQSRAPEEGAFRGIGASGAPGVQDGGHAGVGSASGAGNAGSS